MLTLLDNNKKTIIHVTSEVFPFYKRGGLGDVLGTVPKYLNNDQFQNIVIAPYYKGKMKMDYEYEVTEGSMEFYGIEHKYLEYAVQKDGVIYLFLNLADDEIYLTLENSNDGDQPYLGGSSFMYYLYFGKSVLSTLVAHSVTPDFIYCHDWQSAGVLAFSEQLGYLRSIKEFKSIYVIHNYDYQGEIFKASLDFLPKEVRKVIQKIIDKYNSASMLAIGLEESDCIATVSISYAKELVDGVLPHKGLKYITDKEKVFALLNGVDYDFWHPANSPFLIENYDVDSLSVKAAYKAKFLKKADFTDQSEDKPLLLLMSRLTNQKGIQLLIHENLSEEESGIAFQKLIDLGINIVIYGAPSGGTTGSIHKRLNYLAKKHEGSFVYDPDYTEQKAHQYLAAADMLLAPSLFEPCGLVQIFALAFGTVPVVRPVGGLKDTVDDFNTDPENASGFYLNNFNSQELEETLENVIAVYSSEQWSKIIQNGMKKDYSWDRQKENYFKLMEEISSDIIEDQSALLL